MILRVALAVSALEMPQSSLLGWLSGSGLLRGIKGNDPEIIEIGAVVMGK